MRLAIAKQIPQERIVFEDNRLVPILYGEQNAHLQKIENVLDVEISNRGNEIVLTGEASSMNKAKQVLEFLWEKVQKGQVIDMHDVDSALRFQQAEQIRSANTPTPANTTSGFNESDTMIVTKKKRVMPRTPLQAQYMRAMNKNSLTFGLGPAGTGKTYLAVAMAASMLEAGKIERIILSRPAVEAGERIGFLPGELKEKMDPYMRPLYDALYDMMASDKVIRKIASEEIEIAPLAFMRGRTLTNSFIILDEAQNTTPQQMLMFLTRMGDNSRMVITGDPSQTDLPAHQLSGLVEASNILRGVEDVEFIQFSSSDVVRHPLVGRIIQAYEKQRT